MRDSTAHPRRCFAPAIWALLSLACAVSVPPNGGPEDKSPPTVARTVPRSDSTGVDPKSALRIEFSEPMRRERIERLVVVNPPVEIQHVSWDGNTIIIQPAHDLVRDTTYVVRVKPEYQDSHGVPATQWHEFAFATGSAPLDTARIEGAVTLKRAPVNKAIVRCYRIAGKDTLNLDKVRPDREATADHDGRYVLKYLPSHGERFVVLAFQDQNENQVYDREGDPGAVYADTVVMTPSRPVVAGIDVALLDPKEPGSIKGTVTNESGVDSARVMVAIYEVQDSTKIAYRGHCDATGAYVIRTVRPGTYVVRAFVDVKADSTPGVYPCPARTAGCREPVVRRAGTLRVKAATTATEPPLVIRREEKP